MLGSLSFAAPWLLIALAALPAIYYLLRVTPPPPRRVVFPPLRLLFGLSSREETPARTPLWLLLLRMLAAALVVVALAGPSIGHLPKPGGSGPLVLFVDNDWPAAHAWKARASAIDAALESAARAGRPVAIVPTASGASQPLSLLDAGTAARQAHDLAPQPWLADRRRALKALRAVRFPARPEILWLSDGLDHGHAAEVATALAKLGSVRLYDDAPGNGALALVAQSGTANGFKLTLRRADESHAQAGTVDALGPRGEHLAATPFRFPSDASETTATLNLPLELRNKIARLAIAGRDSAGAVQLLDASSKRRKVGLVAASNNESEQPLLSGLYYLSRALQPYAEVSQGTIAQELAKKVPVLVLSDIGRIEGADRSAIEKFLNDGGVLIRFAGGRMVQGGDDLVPVRLRAGGRYLGSAMGWAEPQHLAPFPQGSPFQGLSVPKDVTVSRQVLAEPSIELSTRSWARLTDGTPLVTGARHGHGWIVLFHVTAGPGWSTLPLSHLYIDMLRRLLDLAGGAHADEIGTSANASYPPLAVLDGYGRLQKPAADAAPIRGRDIVRFVPSRSHPPGLYGAEGAEIALNATNADTQLMPLPALSIPRLYYADAGAVLLAPYLYSAALLLLLLDAAIALWLRGLIVLPRRVAGAALLMLAVPLLLIAPMKARAEQSFDMQAALNTRLAYVITGLPDVDNMSKAGLTGLGLWLKARTSYEPDAPMGVNLATDDLSFFPLLYWPMDPRETALTPAELTKVQNYMRNGGTLFIDTRELTLGATRGPDNPGEVALRRLLSKLDLPPLEPVPSDHVLTKSFYLLSSFPGRWAGGKVWVQALPPPDPEAGPEPARGGDNVSPIIIGSDDYAAAWAVDNQGQPLVALVPGGSRQREIAVRFGINVVMYALTGNYKTDTVHVPALLKRLGK